MEKKNSFVKSSRRVFSKYDNRKRHCDCKRRFAWPNYLNEQQNAEIRTLKMLLDETNKIMNQVDAMPVKRPNQKECGNGSEKQTDQWRENQAYSAVNTWAFNKRLLRKLLVMVTLKLHTHCRLAFPTLQFW